MPQYYVLNNSIEFWPALNQLILRDESRQTLPLNVPAGRCLLLLLERRPQLVLQQDFYPYVWGDEGRGVSVNTLYQNIALLRKGLRILNEDLASAVLTVPKKGFKLSETISIMEVEDDASGLPHTAFPKHAPLTLSEPSPSAPEEELEEKSLPARRKYKILLTLMLYSSIVMAGILILGKQSGFSIASENYFSGYQVREKIQSCIYYANADADNAQFDTMYQLANKVLSCRSHPYRYITSRPLSSASILFACDAPFSGHISPECLTYTNLQEK